MAPVRIAVLGAGGVGCWVAGRLALAGQKPALFARGEGLAALRAKGLTVLGPDRAELAVLGPDKLTVAQEAADAGPVDVLVVAVKTHQLAGAAGLVTEVMNTNKSCLVVPFLNGVGATEDLAALLAARGVADAHRRVMGGVAKCVCYLSAPGVVVFALELSLLLGPVPGAGPEAAEVLARAAAACTIAGIPTTVSPSPQALQEALWAKFLITGVLGPVTALCRAPLDVVMGSEGPREVARRCMLEMQTVGVAAGVRVPDEAVQDALDAGASAEPGATLSTTRDVLAGRPSEARDFCGTVVRLGARHGVPTPATSLVLWALEPQEARARGEVQFALDGLGD